MTMKYLGIAAVIVFVIVAFGYLLLFSVPESDSQINIPENGDTVPAQRVEDIANETNVTGSGSLLELQSFADSVECSVWFEEEGDEMFHGTMFVSDGKLRGDFLTPSPDLNGDILTSIVMDSTVLYTWTEIEGVLYGAKMSLEQADSDDSSSSVPVNKNIRYECDVWEIVDRSIFNPPTEVIFTDISSVKGSGMEYGTVYEEGEF